MEIYETEDPVCAPETIIDSPDNSDIDQDHIKPTEAKARLKAEISQLSVNANDEDLLSLVHEMEQLLVRRGSSVDQLKLKLSRELGKEQRFGLLNIEPEHAESSKLKDMERRITNLERLIGTHLIDPMSALEQDSGASLFQTSGTLIGALERIDSHLSLLANPKTLQAATDRISEAISRIHELQALRQSPEFEEDEKISYLYNMLKRFEPMTAFIPHLIGRLEALQDIHAEAALFSEGLHDVETSSKQLAHLANCITENQKTLLERIKENQQTILQNISKLASV